MSNQGRILLICDDAGISGQLKQDLAGRGGYSVSFESGSSPGVETFRRDAFDIVIVRFAMPYLEAVEVVKGLKDIDRDCVIIAFLEDERLNTMDDLLKLGVYDFINPSINSERLFFLVKKGIELHSLTAANRKFTEGLKEHNAALEKQNIMLAGRIEDATKNLTRLYEDLRSTYMRTIKVLAQAIDARDHYTHSHSENVSKYAVAIAEEMKLPTKDTETIREACELHDLGKIGIEDSILSKPSPLTEAEWQQIKRHPSIGAQILEPLTFLNEVTELVRQHHENYDGSGYPEGRRGENILLGARIIHLADAYESMRSARSYRKVPLSKKESLAEIKQNSGTQFDPNLVKVFLKIVDRL